MAKRKRTQGRAQSQDRKKQQREQRASPPQPPSVPIGNTLLLQHLLGRLLPSTAPAAAFAAPPPPAPSPALPEAPTPPAAAHCDADNVPTPAALMLKRNGHWDVHRLSTREAGVETVLDEVNSLLQAGDAALHSDYRTARAALRRPGVLEEGDLHLLFNDPDAFVQRLPPHVRTALRGVPGPR